VADALNDVCLASDKSIVRVQVTRSGFASTFQVQRISDPGQAAQWASWTVLPGSTGLMFQDGGCAVSNTGGTLHAFAQRGSGGNNLWNWTSTDNGSTWTGPVTVCVPPGGALLKGISSAGNNDVFCIYDASGGEALGCSFYTAGAWSALSGWTLPSLASGGGIAAAWSGTAYTLVYSDGYSLASCVFAPATSSWSGPSEIVASTSSAIARTAPRLSYADALYTLAYIEADSGLLTGSVYSYPRLKQSADLVHWSNGFIAHDLASTYGVVAFKLPMPAAGSTGPRYYLASLASVYSAPDFQRANATQFLDASASVLSYRRVERAAKPASLEVTLDNARGFYNGLLILICDLACNVICGKKAVVHASEYCTKERRLV
jgi:hypothetical protein